MRESATVFGGGGRGGGEAHVLTNFFLRCGSFGVVSAEIFSWQQWASAHWREL